MSERTAAIGKVVFFWSGMLIAATILVSQPPIKGRGAAFQLLAWFAAFPGLAAAGLVRDHRGGFSDNWAYWAVVYLGSFVFWVPLTTYILYRRGWQWQMRHDGDMQ